MWLLALQTAGGGGGRLEEVARTFGVDWTHLLAQCVSFSIVCAVLYYFAYTPILKMLEARRQQIAAGIANAEKIKAELARIEAERQEILLAAGEQGQQLVEEARAAAALVRTQETQKAAAEAAQIVVRAHEAAERERAQLVESARREIAQLVIATTASVTGKVLTADDHRRLAEETASQLAG